MNNAKIVMKLTGEIMPVGQTNEDGDRFENLKSLCETAEELLFEINKVACRTHGNEFSIKRNVDYAKNFLDHIDDMYLMKS